MNFSQTTTELRDLLEEIRAERHFHFDLSQSNKDPVTWILDSTDLILILAVVLLGLIVLLALLAVILYTIKYRTGIITEGLHAVAEK